MKHIEGLPSEAPDALHTIERADIAVAEAASEVQDHPAVEALGEASEMADQPPLIALSVIVLIGGLALRRPVVAVTGARMLGAHLLATGMKTVVKSGVDRTRPHVLAEEGRYLLKEGKGSSDPRLNSFPSGHTAGAVAVAEAIARTKPALAWPARGWAAAIAVIQVPRCSHYPSDIAAGALVGVAADRIVRLAERGIRAALHR